MLKRAGSILYMEDNRRGQTPRQTESDEESRVPEEGYRVLRYNNNYNKKQTMPEIGLYCTKEPVFQRKHSKQNY
jgi:hypothetical protein